MKISERAEYRSKPKPLTFPESATVAEAVAGMTARNFGSVIVTGSDGKMSGMFTERDVMKRVVNDDKDAKKTKLKDVMTADVRVAKGDDNVVDWLRIMSNERFRRLPVVDESGEVVAIMIVGGNIDNATRVLTTAIALETGKGAFSLALALGFILIALALGVNLVIHWMSNTERESRWLSFFPSAWMAQPRRGGVSGLWGPLI